METVAGGLGVQTCRLTILPLTVLADWFMSLGVGLLTFASLETVGIYFGLGKHPLAPPPTPPSRLSAGGGWTSHRCLPRARKPRPKHFFKDFSYAHVFLLTAFKVNVRSLAKLCGKMGSSVKTQQKQLKVANKQKSGRC